MDLIILINRVQCKAVYYRPAIVKQAQKQRIHVYKTVHALNIQYASVQTISHKPKGGGKYNNVRKRYLLGKRRVWKVGEKARGTLMTTFTPSNQKRRSQVDVINETCAVASRSRETCRRTKRLVLCVYVTEKCGCSLTSVKQY